MKKLIVLVMVFGIASIASAGLSFTIGGNDLFTTDSVTTPGSLELVGIADGEATGYTIEISTSNGLTLDTENAQFTDGYMMGNGFVSSSETDARITGSNFTTAMPAGEMFNLGIIGTGDFTFTDIEAGTTATVSVVPEPMTMALLGLGGLFIRRRK